MPSEQVPRWLHGAPGGSGGSWRHAVSLGLGRSRIAETWRWVWSKDGSKVGTAATAASAAAPRAGPVAQAQAAEAASAEPRITPKSRADVRKMLQEERQKLQPPPSPSADREQRAQRAQWAQGAQGVQGAQPAVGHILRRIVGKSPDPRGREPHALHAGTCGRLTGKDVRRSSRTAPPADGRSILYRLLGKSPDPRATAGTPEPRLTRRICGKSPDPRKSPGLIAGTPPGVTRRIVGLPSCDPRGRSRSPRRCGQGNTPQAGTAGTAEPSRGATLREMTPARFEARQRCPGTAEKAVNPDRRFEASLDVRAAGSKAQSERPQRTRTRSMKPEELPLLPLSVANADAMRRAILEPRSGRRPYRSFLALQAMATPSRDDDALASEILDEMRRERRQASRWLH